MHFPDEPPCRRRGGRRRAGTASFTLVEILAALAVLAGLLAVLFLFTGQVNKVWQRGLAGTQRRQNDRAFLDFMATELQFAVMPALAGGTNSLAPAPASWIAAPGAPLLANLPVEQLVINPPGVSASCAQSIFWQAPVATDASAGNLAEVGYCVTWATVSNGPAVSHTGLLRRLLVNPSSSSYYLHTRAAWIDDAVLAAVAPADALHNYEGLFGEDVYALWARALDSYANPIQTDASASPFTGYAFDSRRGYTDSKGGVHPPGSLPAMVEIALVAADARTSLLLARDYPASGSTPANFWQDVNGYVAGFPDRVQKGIRIYSTRVVLSNAR